MANSDNSFLIQMTENNMHTTFSKKKKQLSKKLLKSEYLQRLLTKYVQQALILGLNNTFSKCQKYFQKFGNY